MLRKIHLFGHTVIHIQNYLWVTPESPKKGGAVGRRGMWIIEGHAEASKKSLRSRWRMAGTITNSGEGKAKMMSVG